MTGRAFLGKGWRFPLRPDARGRLAYSEAEQRIAESIWVILATSPGERQMLPRFGCGIHDYVFAPNSPSTRGSIAHEVRQALTRWEPRIDLLEVRVESPPGEANRLLIRIAYRVRSTNAFHNLVYPFYIREGQGG